MSRTELHFSPLVFHDSFNRFLSIAHCHYLLYFTKFSTTVKFKNVFPYFYFFLLVALLLSSLNVNLKIMEDLKIADSSPSISKSFKETAHPKIKFRWVFFSCQLYCCLLICIVCIAQFSRFNIMQLNTAQHQFLFIKIMMHLLTKSTNLMSSNMQGLFFSVYIRQQKEACSELTSCHAVTRSLITG